ncbi:caspase-12-like [Grammomys surdaster]|uniref:caspase-12-like n=1 Tax=Grammomys surdaster TaxID=491861 RepID=UPI00109F64EB|nr:caspase-12-like [Grammomys surdaster]XP_028627165.1 caspase-12-like [Grammomys surdaster]XP_028627166.1 caspase-12-like [Grammomys surdaster]
MLDGVFDDLVEKNVLNGDELLKIGEEARFILNNTENLVESFFEKTEMAGKIFAGHIANSHEQLSLKFSSNDEYDEPQKMCTPSFPSDSENEIKDSKDEGQALLRQTSSLSLMESKGKEEDEEMEVNAGVTHASHLMLTVPQGIQSSEVQHTLKLCPRDQFCKMKTERAKEEMETELMQFAARPEHQSSDSTFLVFMSHGILEGICGVKHRNKKPDVLHDDTIFTIFNNSNCRSLRNKPKILIMQACRGRHTGTIWVSTNKGIATADTDEECVLSYKWNNSITKAHVETDFIAFKSSTPYNISWKVGKHGSLFISKLIDCFKKYCWRYHLEEIFRKVQHSFEVPGELTQMPTIERVSMTRYFYLFPGN